MLWSRLPSAESTAKVPPFSMRGVPAIAADPREGFKTFAVASRLTQGPLDAPLITMLSRDESRGELGRAILIAHEMAGSSGEPRAVEEY